MAEVRADLEQCATAKAAIAGTEPQSSIAVLPFVNMSGDKEQEYFSDGLAEEIINALTQIPGLKVTARTSAFAFKGKQKDIRKIAEALGVANVLEGSVRKAGSRIRVTAQLIAAADGNHIWSERYDRELTDVFAIQDEISQAIAEKLRVRLSGAGPLIKRHTENVEAYNLYLKARYHFYKLTPEGFEKCKEYCEQGIAVDPNYALAWFGLADFYYLGCGALGLMPPKTAYQQCRQAALKALELDELLPQAHSMMGALRAWEYDWKRAEQAFSRAFQLDPNSMEVWNQYVVTYLMPMGRMDEALAMWHREVELDPLSPHLHYRLGLLHMGVGQYDLAIEKYTNVLELDHRHSMAHFNIGYCNIKKGNVDEGIRSSETAARLMKRSPLALGRLGAAYAQGGKIGEARGLLEKLLGLAQKTYVPASAFALIYCALGEIDKVLPGWKRHLRIAILRSRFFLLCIACTNPCAPTRATTPCCAR